MYTLILVDHNERLVYYTYIYGIGVHIRVHIHTCIGSLTEIKGYGFRSKLR